MRSIRDIAVHPATQPPKHIPIPVAVVSAKKTRSTKNIYIDGSNQEPKVRRPKIIYKTSDPSPDSRSKILKLKNVGLNKALLIIGNGPSINEVDFTSIKSIPNIHTLSINKPDPRLWPTNYWAFFDTSQVRRHKNLWDSYDGIIFNSTAIKNQKPSSMQFKNIGGKGFNLDPSQGIYIGRSSVYAAMQIAIWMNYLEIFIFGCDMNPAGINGVLHFYGDNPDVNPVVRKNRFKNEAEYYDLAAETLDEPLRKRIYFCSTYNHWSFVRRFNSLDHKEAVDYIVNKYQQ